MLGERTNGFFDLLLLAGELAWRVSAACELGDRRGGRFVDGGVAVFLQRDANSGLQLGSCGALDCFIQLGAVVEHRRVRERFDATLRGDDARGELTLQLDRLFDPLLRRLEASGDDRFAYLRRAVGIELERLLGAAGFDHHDGDVAVVKLASCDDEFERAGIALFERRVGNPSAFLRVRHAHCANRPIKRDAANHQSCRRRVNREHVVRVDLVGAQHGDDNLRLVAITVGERRTKRAVDQTAREDRLLTRASFTTEERARDLAGCIRALFYVHREGEEVDAVAHALGGVGGDEHRRLANAGDDGPLRLQGKFSGFEPEGFVGSADRARHGNGFSHGYFSYVVLALATGDSPMEPLRWPPA